MVKFEKQQQLQQKLPQAPRTSRRTSINYFPDPRQQKTEKSNYFNELLASPDLLSQFRMVSHIGKGSFSVVHSAVEKDSNKAYAIKAYEKIDNLEWYRLQNLKRQISNLQSLTHRNIVNLQFTLKDKQKIYLVMDNGGKQSLAGLLRKQKKFSEIQAKQYFKQLLTGVAYCHEKGVCHRDLKLENILLDEQGNIKIIDFGFSHRTNKKLNSYCGTPPYMCPEIVKKIPYFGMHADIWALGVILYLMLVGTFPFRASNQKQLYRLIQQGKYQLPLEISNFAKDILGKMLETNPYSRATAQKLLHEKWIA